MKFTSIVFPTAPIAFSYTSDLKELNVGDLVAAPLRGKITNGIVLEISEKKPPHLSIPLSKLNKIVRKNILGPLQITAAQFIIEYFAAHTGKTLRLFVPERVWQNHPLKRKIKNVELKSIPQPQKNLNSAQKKAVAKILSSKKPCLLHGITGSGKTEVYLRVIQENLKSGKSAILLVPEIALTPQLVGYFAASIPSSKIAVIHSNLAEGFRLAMWERIHSGEIKLVIGSRSALFAPVKNLGVIVLDEEHEWTYKNDQSPRYHARAVAWKIAQQHKVKLILGSATPNIESYFAAQSGRADLLELTSRTNNANLPKVVITDLRNELKLENYSPFSEILKEKIIEKLDRGEQIILLLNKRGYSSAIVCRDCGEALTCRNCSLPLTFHKFQNRCLCHACGYFEPPPIVCPQCGSAAIKFLGRGTQKIESELKKFFPSARVLRADRDTTSTRDSHANIYNTFRSGSADILIGTQIVAKGLDLPNVSLVGVLLADIGLHLPDFRASEKTFSLLTQIAGRAGRGKIAGEVIIQTYSPEHPAIRTAAKHNFKDFFTKEIQERKKSKWPPFQKIVKFIFVDKDKNRAYQSAKKFAKKLQEIGEKNISLAPALIWKLHDKYHFHIIWRGNDPRKLLKKIDIPNNCQVDVDPVNLS